MTASELTETKDDIRNVDLDVQSTNKKEKNRMKWQRGAYSAEFHEESRWYIYFMVNIAFNLMMLSGYLTEWLKRMGLVSQHRQTSENSKHKGFPGIGAYFEYIYVNYIYRISSDVCERPVCSVPGSVLTLKERVTDDYGWTYRFTGKEQKVINMGSYNYLGFSHNTGVCSDKALSYLSKYGVHVGSTRHEAGNHKVQKQVEKCIADYIGVEDAVVFPMGFGTNSMNIPALVDKNSLIMSDQLNHSSIVLGCRMSGAAIKTFKHNNAEDCERVLRDALARPSPKTGKPYNKVLIIIEGIYSMEGTIVHLPPFIEIKKKYNCYLFLDEAHSIGAVGPTGKGVTEYWNCNPRDVDIMMGTLTKSFAAAGGYMAGNKKVIDHIRHTSAGPCYGGAMSPPVIAQVLSSMKIMLGQDGTDIGIEKSVKLLRNSRYFRHRLRQMGFLIYGHDDSPVVPLLTFYVTKVVEFSRLIVKRGVGVVAVGFPATPMDKARVRFCLSSDHTKQQLDYVLEMVDQIGNETGTKYGTKEFVGQTIEY